MKLKLLFYSSWLVILFASSMGYGFNAAVKYSEERIEATAPLNHADISVGKTHVFGLTPKSEILVHSTQLYLRSGDKHFLKFQPTIDFSRTLFQVEFKHYTGFFDNCLIASRKSDLIFPFHYFW